MKSKTINAVLAKKFKHFSDSIDDEMVKELVLKNTIITGGCIVSMLLKEKVNDYDIYFRNKETAKAVAEYYVKKFHQQTGQLLTVQDEDGRIRIMTAKGHRGETAMEHDLKIQDPGEIEDAYEDAHLNALTANDDDDDKPIYRPVFMTTNAITLSNQIQIVLRFYGEPEEIHKNYDFVHCTNYWTSKEREVVLHKDALESILAKELRYVGSLYPVCSIFRMRKFIKRGWQINAGQILKMVWQINELDLSDIKVLEDQLTGVDVAYFAQVVTALKEKDPEKVNAAYLVEILNRMF